MGMVATVFKVYSDDTEGTAKAIKEKLSPKSLQLMEIAFGIKVIKVMFVHEDSEGSNIFEDRLRNIEGVKEVEVEDETLL
ncbi:MAG: elongation factor 1-beta [Candidatus Micrarchaeota archaeon]|nr:elongation factor 1-beta [Candidatus Micrarchaeota archaeon]MDE1823871.1 elongation factor 1-beta [Candidatus Micrarchaeota archaeon]MDE1849285.1 elongation factor 1-beta [Candidatus Micrarchaeota archaeon]